MLPDWCCVTLKLYAALCLAESLCPPAHACSWTFWCKLWVEPMLIPGSGSINPAEQNVGQQMHADVISPGHPTGFPIYRTSWQRLGTIERRLRACYSGVQAVLPAPGAPELRELELYLKVRANGMALDGPSIRR